MNNIYNISNTPLKTPAFGLNDTPWRLLSSLTVQQPEQQQTDNESLPPDTIVIVGGGGSAT